MVFDQYPSVHLNQGVKIQDIAKNSYIDNIIAKRAIPDEATQLKETAIAVFKEVEFKLHKWKSNLPELGNES